MSGLITIKDNNGIEKIIPYIRGADGQTAYKLASSKGFPGSEPELNRNLAGMDNPYYSIGSVYYSTVSTSPASLFGFGTWEQLQDVMIIPVSSTYTLGSTGGAPTVTLTTAQLPEHRHYETRGRYDSGSKCVYTPYMNNDTTVSMESTGGGKAHNNMPPYVAVYAWKRVS